MNKKRKKIMYYIILSFTMLGLIFSGVVVKANDEPIVHYIFDKQVVKAGDTFSLTLILEDYHDLATFQFVCEVNKEVFNPIVKNDEYFLEPTLSLFEKTEVYENTYLENDSLLKFVAITKGGKSYDYSGLNQVFTINFETKKDIDKVEEYFYEKEIGGSRVLLIDKKAKEIKASVNYNEVLKATWGKDLYQIEVFGSLPNILNDIKVINRQVSDYKIEIIDDELLIDIVGSYVLKVKIYDYITSQIIYLAKPIKIVDTTAPIVDVTNYEVVLEDVKLDSCNFDYFLVKDNYDQTPSLLYKYYNKDDEEISSVLEFKKYLKNNSIGKISLKAIDSSNNESLEKEVTIKIKDTTAPYINEVNYIEVIDTQLEEFSLETLFIIKDEYDLNPKFMYKIITNDVNIENNYIEALRKLYDITIEYWTIDKSNNESKHYNLNIKLKDTIPPVIKNVNDIVVADEELYLYLNNHHLFEKDFEITDNFNKELKLNIVYYDNERIITEDEFFANLRKGQSGNIRYQVVDSYDNKSEELLQKISVLDDTAPVIKINNIENQKQYLGPIKIDYVIEDNIDENLVFEVLVNGNPYNGEELIDLSEYTLIITAIDKSGNKSIKEISFEIVERNFFGCIDGFDCAENNYAVGIIIGIIIALIVGAVVTIEIFYIKKKKKEQSYLEE